MLQEKVVFCIDLITLKESVTLRKFVLSHNLVISEAR